MLTVKTSLHYTHSITKFRVHVCDARFAATLLPPCGIMRQAENMRLWKSTNGKLLVIFRVKIS